MNIKHYSLQSQLVHWKIASVAILLSVAFCSCVTKIHPPPTTQPVTVTIKNIFINCHYPANSSKPLTYLLTFTVYYYTGASATGSSTGKIALPPTNITSSATNPASTVTFNALIPSDGTTWTSECVIKATQCSTCAVQNYPNDACNQYQTTIGGVSGIAAAKPTISFSTNFAVYLPSVPPTIDVASGYIKNNVAGSCGCLVPYN